MIEHLDREISGRRGVGDDHIERVGGELADELFRIIFATNEPNRLGLLQRRSEQSIHEQLGDGIRNADRQLNAAAG